MKLEINIMGKANDDSPTVNRLVLADVLEQYQDNLVAFIKKSLSTALQSKVEAHDILQDTMISAIKQFDSADFERREPFSWLCHLAEQRIIDAHRHYVGSQKRSAKRETSLETHVRGSISGGMLDILVASMTTPTQAIRREECTDALHEIFVSLPDEQKEALRLRYVEGLSLQEISDRLGKSNGAVRVMLSRSVAKVQNSISDETKPFVIQSI